MRFLALTLAILLTACTAASVGHLTQPYSVTMDSHGRVLARTTPGKTTAYAYDSYGRLTSKTITDTATAATRVTTYTYYANTTDPGGNVVLGRLHTVDGPRTDVADVTTYTYDTNLDISKITNALGQETNITARDAAGRPTKTTDVNGVETDLAYDSNGRLTSSVVAPGTSLEATTAYVYDADGNLTKLTLPNGVYLDYAYDSAQRLSGITDAAGNTIAYTRDAAGNITHEDIRDSSSALKYTQTRVYDELARLIESIGAASQTADYAYDKDSNRTRYTDQNNNATAYAYDPLLRFTSSTDAVNGDVKLGYNGLDALTTAKDQRANTTTYSFIPIT